jgi:hypothetical protein
MQTRCICGAIDGLTRALDAAAPTASPQTACNSSTNMTPSQSARRTICSRTSRAPVMAGVALGRAAAVALSEIDCPPGRPGARTGYRELTRIDTSSKNLDHD